MKENEIALCFPTVAELNMRQQMLNNTETRQLPSDKNLAQSFCEDQLYVTKNIYSTVPLLNTEPQNNWGWYLWRSLSLPPPPLKAGLTTSSCTGHHPKFWISPRITHQFSNDITFIFILDLVEACDSFPLHFESVDYKCLQPVFIKNSISKLPVNLWW